MITLVEIIKITRCHIFFRRLVEVQGGWKETSVWISVSYWNICAYISAHAQKANINAIKIVIVVGLVSNRFHGHHSSALFIFTY